MSGHWFANHWQANHWQANHWQSGVTPTPPAPAVMDGPAYWLPRRKQQTPAPVRHQDPVETAPQVNETVAVIRLQVRVEAKARFRPRPLRQGTTAEIRLRVRVEAETDYHDQLAVIRDQEQELLLAGVFDEEW